MKVIREDVSLSECNFWSGAIETYKRLEDEDMLDEAERLIEECYPDGIEEGELNDLLWFDDDWLYESLGMETEESITNRMKEIEYQMDDIKSEYEDECDDRIAFIEDEDQKELTEEEKESIRESIWEVDYEMEYDELESEYGTLDERYHNLFS